MHGGPHRRKLRAVFHVLLNRRIAQFVEEVGFPIPLKARWVNWIEHAIQCRMRYRTDKIQRRLLEPANRLENFLRFFQGSGVTTHSSAHFFILEMFWTWGSGWYVQGGKKSICVVRECRDDYEIA